VEHEMGIRGSFKCESCDRMFKIKEGLDSHKCRQNQPKGRKKETAQKEKRQVYEYNYLVESDFEKFSRNGKPVFRCNFCSIEKFRLGNIKEHILKHKPHLKPYKCSHCDKRFVSKSSYRKHEETHEVSDDAGGDLEQEKPGSPVAVVLKQEKGDDPLLFYGVPGTIMNDPDESNSTDGSGNDENPADSDKSSSGSESEESSGSSWEDERAKKIKKSSTGLFEKSRGGNYLLTVWKRKF
jgi:hypothetical protein